MDTSFDEDDDFDGDDDSGDDDNDFDKNFDRVIDSDEDGFSDDYEEFIGSDPQDPTDLPFYPYEDLTETYPKKKIISKSKPIVEEENQQPIRLVRGSPTRNRCLLFLIIFMAFLILIPFIFLIIFQ